MPSGRWPTRAESITLLAVSVFPIYSWTNLWFLHKLPSWILFLQFSEIVGIFSYAQAMALLESVALFLCVAVLARALPSCIFGDDLVVEASTLMLVHVPWISLIHFVGRDIAAYERWRALSVLLMYVVSVGASLALVRRSPRVARILQGLVQRLNVMLYLYIPLGILGLGLVIVRNLLGQG